MGKKLTLAERLEGLIAYIYNDDCFCAPEEWEVDEMCYLLTKCVEELRKNEQQK